MSARIYVVNDTRVNPSRQRLVRAINRSQALRFVAQDAFAVDVAGQNTLVFLLGNGTPIEDATSEPEGEASQPEQAAAA